MAPKRNGQKELGSIEVYFAKKLANNDKVVRDRAVKRIKTWLSSKPGDSFDQLDMMKLWKGLFYCMWFSDKPLVQQDLATLLAKLIHSLRDLTAVCKFIDAFVLTMGREWHGIDVLRLDKFYMLIRKVLREAFVYVQAMKWDEDTVTEISQALFNGPCNAKTNAFPNGVIMFMTEIFVEELRKQIKEPKPEQSVLTKLFDPFISLFAYIDSGLVSKCINEEIFRVLLLHRANVASTAIEIDLEKFGSRMFEEGTKGCVTAVKRKKLFSVSKVFKEAAVKKAGDDSLAIEKQSISEEEKPAKKTMKRKTEKGSVAVKQKRRKKGLSNDGDFGGKVMKGNDSTDSPGAKDNSLSNVDNEVGMLSAVESLTENISSDIAEKDEDISEVKQKLDFESPLEDDESAIKKKGRKMSKMQKKIRSAKRGETKDVLDGSETAGLVDRTVAETITPDVGIDKEIGGNVDGKTTAQKTKKINRKSRTSEKKGGKRKSRNITDGIASDDSTTKKKVVFELDKNAVTSIASLKINPAKVFTPDQKPIKGVLKTPTPRKRACDFF